MADEFLDTIENLSRFHREHEKFYAQRPREQAVALQRHSRALSALADRWEHVDAQRVEALSPYQGADDLNAPEALQLDGILFMEGNTEPAEITSIIHELRAVGTTSVDTGTWLAEAMENTWATAAFLLGYEQLSDLVGDRHRIIANDWQAASMSSLAGRALQRAADVLDAIDFTPAALRDDLDGPRRSPRLLHSAVELIDHAADLLSDSAGLVHDNERRWRTFHQRVIELC
jgi:citrate lyase beta subunit